jgi:vancomycin resistance protein VanJ
LRVWSRAALLGLAWLYLAGLGGWFAANRLLGDRWWWLFILNALALYLFAPLPLLAVAAAIVRQRALWLGFAAAAALCLFLYGGLWVHRPPPATPSGPAITVMTYNVLGFNDCPECVVAAIRASGADLVTLQELSPAVAAAIAWDLSSEYPYQVLAPKEGVTGLGTISRLPMRATGESLPGSWVGKPQVLALTLDGTRVLIVNAHPFATNPAATAVMAGTVRERYRQAQTLVAFAQTHPGPLLYPCDCNTADQNDAYRLIATAWHDSWREAGTGWGQTFPGTDSSGHSTRLVLHGITIPQWLVRIDYVWHSAHWQAVEARLGPWDGHSDHRPTIARLVLVSR